MKKVLLIAIAALMAVVMTGCAGKVQEVPELLTPVGSAMDTVPCEIGTLEQTAVYEAAFSPEYVEVFSDHDVKIGRIGFTLGESVNEGDVLIELDVSDVRGEINALDAEKAALIAESEYQASIYEIDTEIFALRLKKLTGDEKYALETEAAVYDLEYSNAENTRKERLTAIENRRAELEKQLENTQILSPCTGKIVYMGCAAGQVAGAYDTICVVTDENGMCLRSSFISAADIADAVEYYAVSNGARIEITPREIDEAEYARSMLRNFEYQRVFDVDCPDAAFGDSAVVHVVTLRKENVLKVPRNAVFSDDDGDYVYVVEGESRSRRNVTTGERSYEETEITDGLSEGEVVYVSD